MVHALAPNFHGVDSWIVTLQPDLMVAGVLVSAFALLVLAGSVFERAWVVSGVALVVLGLAGTFFIGLPTAAANSEAAGERAFREGFAEWAASSLDLTIEARLVPVPGRDQLGVANEDSQTVDGRLNGKLIDVKLVRHGDTWDVYVPAGGPLRKLSE